MKRFANALLWTAMVYGFFLMMALLEAILMNWNDPSQSPLIQATWIYPMASVVVLAIPLAMMAIAGIMGLTQMALESSSDRRLLRAHEARRQARGHN